MVLSKPISIWDSWFVAVKAPVRQTSYNSPESDDELSEDIFSVEGMESSKSYRLTACDQTFSQNKNYVDSFSDLKIAMSKFLARNASHSYLTSASLLSQPQMFTDPVLALAMIPPIAAPPLQSNAVRLYRPQTDSFADLIFPGFDGDSFIWKMSLFQIGEFLFSVAAGNDHGIPSTCTLYNLGASWGPSIASGQIWRLILPMTLHANMMHLSLIHI